MTRSFIRNLAILATPALLIGCSGGSSSVGSGNDAWQLSSDAENGGWEMVMLTEDQAVQEEFEAEHGFEFPSEGLPALWLRKVDELEPYEPELWAVDDEGNRIPFNYVRSSDDGSTYIGASLVSTPSSNRTLKTIQLEVRGEKVAEWDIKSPTYQKPNEWPAAEGDGGDMSLAGVDLNIKPSRQHQAGGENNGSFFRMTADIEIAEGMDEDFEYELRYTVPDEAEATHISQFYNRPTQGGRGGGGGGRGPGGGGRAPATYETIESYSTDLLCQMMKYKSETLEISWNADLASYNSLEALEKASAPSVDIDNGHFEVYGMYWLKKGFGGHTKSAWLRIKGVNQSRFEFDSDLASGWSSLFFNSGSAGNIVDQYQLDDGSTIIVFEGSGMYLGWGGGEFTINGQMRNVAAYGERVTQMNLPVTRLVPADD